MLIDWLTVLAQFFNFFLLVWLLNRFLFKPVLAAIDIRDKTIASKIHNAEEAKKQADEAYKTLQNEKEDFEKKKASLFSQVIQESQLERKKLTDEARQEAIHLRIRLGETIQKEQKEAHDTIVRKIEQEVFVTTKKVLHDLANADIEKSIVEQFIIRLSTLNESDKNALLAAFTSNQFPTKIFTCFQLPEKEKIKIQEAFKNTFKIDLPITYECSKEGICGIELVTNGYKMRWRILDYLEEIQCHS